MKNRHLIKVLFLLVLLTPIISPAQNQSIVKWDSNGLFLDNGVVSRYISFQDEQVRTISLRIPSASHNFVTTETPEPDWVIDKNSRFEKSETRTGQNPLEFSFMLDDRLITGHSGWEISDIQNYNLSEGEGATLFLKGHGLELQISYLIYPNLPVIRKMIKVINRSSKEVKIENFDVESLNISGGSTQKVIYQNYARYKRIGPFTGDWDDPLVAVHNQRSKWGILLGNETPGVLKRTSSCLDGRSISVGLTHIGQEYPFRVWLNEGEEWESPWIFVIPYQDVDPKQTIEGPLDDFVRDYMGIRLAELEHKPTFVYNTWNPFRKKIDEKLIMELADAAAECGIEEFVIDDGWQNNRGDWEIDYEKFPNGLKPVFDYIKSKGMKPGLWLGLANIAGDSEVFNQHPEWCVTDKNGNPTNVHTNERNMFTTCMTSGWKDYIKGVIVKLVKEHGLEYVKLDLAVVTSAYVFDRTKSGCYASNHSHKDREESMLEIYRNTWELFDELHAEAPELFIDCTFETMGTLQMIDFDMCKHAEGNWLSNFEGRVPHGSLRVRQMGWWRSGVIPATALVIGNQTMDDPNWELSFQSLLGSLPIMLGDPRKVKEQDKLKMNAWSVWMNEMQSKYNYMMFRQDLPGFGEPSEGSWDGWARINTKSKKGGIVGVFRQGGIESERKIIIPNLSLESNYLIKDAPSGELIYRMTGKQIQEDGFVVRLTDKYDAKIFSVEAE